jgi:hypothetical protein
MNQELQQKLFEKYPKIFRQKDLSMKETLMCWGISCGDGWYNIVDTLCGHLQGLVDRPHEDIEMHQQWIEDEKKKDEPSKERIESYKERIEEYKKKIIPQLEAVQVKEKYGSLRFYLSGYPRQPEIDARVTAYINFAESMSCVTCEQCGMPGKQRGGHWVFTLCKACDDARSEEWAKSNAEARQLKIPFEEN